MDTFDPIFQDEEKARDFFEGLRWPGGAAVCAHCGNDGGHGRVARLHVRGSRRRLYKCYATGCRKQFSLTQGTILQDSPLPVHLWLLAMFKMSASKKGISSLQLARELGISQKSAWHLCHRIRLAMTHPSMLKLLGGEPLADDEKLTGTVEADEVWLGPRRLRGVGTQWAQHKTPVMTLVERGGRARSFIMPHVSSKTVRPILERNISQTARLATDGASAYKEVGQPFAAHGSVDHTRGEYARGWVSVNQAESYFAMLRRGIAGSFHHISKRHMGRYLAEFDFRHDTRQVSDGERMQEILRRSEGRILRFHEPIAGWIG